MLIVSTVNNGTLPALERLVAYTEARHDVLAENIANADTPGYKTKQLDAKTFQQALGEAMDRRRETGTGQFVLESGRDFTVDERGRLAVQPTTAPVENVLFHDGTNMQIERQMAYLAENAMTHEVANELLRNKFNALMTAIRGRMS
jgi:flagellar basal-body rod protein FlgB